MKTLQKHCSIFFIFSLVFTSLLGCDYTTGEKVYNKRFYQYGYAVQETAEGGFILAGDSVEGTGQGSDMYVVKVDSTGDIEWSKTVGHGGQDTAYDVLKTSDGYIMAGVSETEIMCEECQPTWDSGDARVIKVDFNGSIVWDYWSGFERRDTVRSIIETSEGFIATGYAQSDDENKNSILILKLDENGNEISLSRITDSGDRGYRAEKIQETTDGYIICGSRSNYEGAEGSERRMQQAFLMKISKADNSIIWEETFGDIDCDEKFNDFIIDSSGNLIAVGYKTDSWYGGTYKSGYLVKTDSSGSVLIEYIFTGDGSSEVEWNDFSSITAASNGAFVVAGETKSYGIKSKYRNDALVVKYNNDASVSWIKAYDDQDNNNYAMDIITRTDGGFGIIGSTFNGIMDGMDFYCLKLDVEGNL